MSNDPYIDPDTGVLRNKFGIDNPETLERALFQAQPRPSSMTGTGTEQANLVI